MYDGPVQDVIDELGRLPGIGPKSAQRIAFHLLKLPKTEAQRLAAAIVEVMSGSDFVTGAAISQKTNSALRVLTRRDKPVRCVL